MKKHVVISWLIGFGSVLVLLLLMFGIKAAYQLGTQDRLEAVVTATERVCESSKSCHWMVLTDRMSFTNQDAFWHFKFDSTDLQAKLAEGELYTFHYYGWRIPFLSVYPNIVSVE